MITVKNIFDRVSKINPDTNSYGYVDSAKEQIAQSYFNDIYSFIPAGTLAHKIATDTIGRFTDKQLWVIAYELLKNADYVATLEAEAKKANVKNASKKEPVDSGLSLVEKAYSIAHNELIRSNYSNRAVDAMFDAEVMLDSAVENSRKYYGMSYDEKQAQLKWEYDEIIAEINVEND